MDKEVIEETVKSDRYYRIFNDINKKIKEIYKKKNIQLYSYIRLGLFAKYIKSIKAIYKLDIEGFYEDAKIILRTVFETFITIVYCEISPKERYKRFFDFNVFTRSKYFEADDEVYKILQELKKEQIEEINRKKKNFKKIYKNKSTFCWNDMSTKKLCNELDLYYNTSFYSSMYTLIYMQYSEFIHPNMVNIFENYISIENKKININNKTTADNENMELIVDIEKMNEKLLKIGYE